MTSKPDIISNLRAIIISSKGGLKLNEVGLDYRETFGVDIPLKILGCKTLEEFFRNNPQNFTLNGGTVHAVIKPSSLHIASLVSKQKSSKKKGRSNLVSKEAHRLRKPVKNNNDASAHIFPQKSSQTSHTKFNKQNSKESLSSNLKNLQIQQLTLNKANYDNIPLGHEDEKKKHLKNNRNFKAITKTLINDHATIAKDSGSSFPRNTEMPEISHLLKTSSVPFEDIEDLNITTKSQSRLLKLKSTYLINNKIQSNGSTSSNTNCKNYFEDPDPQNDINISSTGSPFHRSLAKSSEKEILSAKKIVSSCLLNDKKNVQQNENIQHSFNLVPEEEVKYEKLLKEFCQKNKLIMPTYSVVVRETSYQIKCYGCNLNIGNAFHVSTYPMETNSEVSARELASKKALNQLISNKNLPKTLYDTEWVIRLREMCSQKKLPEPIFKSIECHPKNEPKYFICKVRIGEDLLLSSYPTEATNEFAARDVAAKKAFDHLSLGNTSPTGIAKDAYLTLTRIFDMLKSKDYGIWRNKLQSLYMETYNENLPSNWFDLVSKSPKFEIINIEKLGCIVRAKSSSDDVENSSNTLPLASLKVPDSNQWEIYVTNVVTSAEIWCRLIGKDYSEVYDSMMTKLELHPPTENVKNPIVGEIYLVNLEESWNRVRILEIVPNTNEVSVFLIDVGVDEVVKTTQLFYLAKEFFSVAPQAILLSLNELDCLGACEELQLALFHTLLGNTFIAEVVAILDEGSNVSSVNLWDTSTEEDINVNLKLLDDVIKTMKSPNLPTIGMVQEMFVSHIDDNGDVYLRVNKQNASFLEWIISTKMKNSGSLAPVSNKKVDPKKLYITRCSKTGLFYRAKLVKAIDGNTVLMKCIDYGYKQQAAIDELFDLELTLFYLATIPSQVVQAKFATSKVLSDQALNEIREQVLEQNVLVKVVETPQGCIPTVELLKRSQIDGTLSSVNNKVINEETKKITAPSRKKSFVVGLEDTLSRNLPMPSIPPVGSYFNVFVTLAAHPSLFSVQPLTTQNELMKLMFRLQEKCEKSHSKSLSPEEFKIGELYAVKHSDNFWYRSYAQALAGSSNYIVYLCDFGDFIEASADKLMVLPTEFKTFPYQAIRAYLAGIKPADKDWPAMDCIYFRELVVEKHFVSQIIEINRDVNNPNYISLGLVLVDTSANEDVYIHKVLLDKKMAVLKK